MIPLSRSLASWRRLPEPIRFAVCEALKLKAEVADRVAEVDDGSFVKEWRAEAKGLRTAIHLLKAAEKKRKVKR